MSTVKKRIILKKLNEFKTIWHPESTLVFKSQKERLVIGRYVDGELIQLDDTAIDLCEEFNFFPDESLLETCSGENTPENISDNETDLFTKTEDQESVEDSNSGEVDDNEPNEGNLELADNVEVEETKVQETEVQETEVQETEVQETEVQETEVQETEVQETKVEETKVEDNELEEKVVPKCSTQECIPVIEMCSDLLSIITKKEIDLRNFLIGIQSNLDNERSTSINLSLTLAQTQKQLSKTLEDLNSLQEKYDVITKKLEHVKSIFG
jgi:hypothetical protein